MKYHIPSIYYSDSTHPIIIAYEKGVRAGQLNFLKWLKRESGSNRVSGNFEDGWTIEFDNETKYTWFVLKWSSS